MHPDELAGTLEPLALDPPEGDHREPWVVLWALGTGQGVWAVDVQLLVDVEVARGEWAHRASSVGSTPRP